MSKVQARIRNGQIFAEGLAKLLPGASARAVQRFFDCRADLRTLARWKSGQEWPADWAVQRVLAQIALEQATLETIAAQVRPGPGRKGHRATLKQFIQGA